MILPPFATYWAKRLGAQTTSLVQLSGGINNRVYSCSTQNVKWVIKAYPNQNNDQKNRMKAEVDFLQYAAIAAPGYTPKLLEIDNKRRCIIIEYLSGDQFLSKVQIPTFEHLQYSADFISKLNEDIDLAKEMVELDAVEGFDTLSKHVQCIHERLISMEIQHIPIQFKSKAGRLLDLLKSRITEVGIMLNFQIKSGFVEDRLMICDKWVSPSDFGFHNAVWISNHIKFIDFEFAGWDDPVKTVLDFWMQPRIHIPNDWIRNIFRLFDEQNKLHLCQRLIVAADIFELKWASIILSVLNPVKYNNILLNLPNEDRIKLVANRLEKSTGYLAKLYSDRFKKNFLALI